MKAMRRRERGATGLEYAALFAIAAVIVGAILVAIWNSRVDDRTCEAVGEIIQTEGGDCASADGGDGGDTGGDTGGDSDTGTWICDTFGLPCGPDEDGSVDGPYEGDLPPGLSPDDDLVEILSSTPEGRYILQWLADNGVTVTIDSSVTGAYYDPGLNEIVLGNGRDIPTTLVHEFGHAYYANTGLTVNDQATSISRDAYVGGMLDEEAMAVVISITTARDFTDAGHPVTHNDSSTYWDAHAQARQDALDRGLSQTEANNAAERAGFEAIRELFINGHYVTSTTGQSYEDYYGSFWDSVNP